MRHTVDNIIDFDENDPLVKRLSALDIEMPETLIPRVLAARRAGARSHRSRPRKLLVTAVAVAGLLVANLGASYVSPRYAEALVDAPGVGTLTGPILQQAGLATTGAQPLNVQATFAGYTVRLFGAYADAVRTTVFIQILGPDGGQAPDGTAPGFDTTLTDQFGHTYHMANGFGMPVVSFEPLTGPAATLGARLTLRVDNLVVNMSAPQPAATAGVGPGGTKADIGTLVHGPWSLQFTVTSSGGTDLVTPPAVHLGDTTYTFTAVHRTASLLEIKWTVTGGAVARMQPLAREVLTTLRDHRPLPSALTAQQRANYDALSTYRLLDPSGNAVDPVYGFGRGVMQGGKNVAMEMDVWYPLGDDGTYRFQVSNSATEQDVRSIVVP